MTGQCGICGAFIKRATDDPGEQRIVCARCGTEVLVPAVQQAVMGVLTDPDAGLVSTEDLASLVTRAVIPIFVHPENLR